MGGRVATRPDQARSLAGYSRRIARFKSPFITPMLKRFLVLLALTGDAAAECEAVKPVQAKLEVVSCKSVDTSKLDAEFRAEYSGVLVTTTTKLTGFVSAAQKLECSALKPKAKFDAKVETACCDGDPNVPCLVSARKIFSNVKVSK